MRVIQKACGAALLLALCFTPRLSAQTETRNEDARAAAQAAIRQHHYPEAIRLLEGALKNSPNDAKLKTELGKAYLYNHQDDRAMGLFREALRDDPSNRIAKLELARALGYHRQYEDSNRLYRELLDTKSGEAAEVGLVRNLTHQGKKAEASREVKSALARYPDSVKLQEYSRRLDSQKASRQREPKAAALESRGEIRGTVSYLSDSAGNRSFRSSQQFQHSLTSFLSNKFHTEERSVWQTTTATPRANVLWLNDELQFHPNRLVTVSGGGGLTRFFDGSTHGLYNAGLEVRPARAFSLSTEFERMPIVPTYRAATFRILADEWNTRLAWTPRGWDAHAYGSIQRYSDTNRGKRASAEVVRWLGKPAFSVGVGYQFRYISFDQALLHGYFEPRDYKSHLAVVGVKYRVGRAFRAEYLARAGGETIAGAPFKTAWEVSLRHRLNLNNWILGGDYSYFRVAQDAGPYNSQMGRFLVAYRF